MKKTLFFLLALVTTVCLSSCSGPNEDPDGGLLNDQKGEMDLLSPDEQKDLLVEVGEELIQTFNPEDQKECVEVAENLYNKYKDYDWNAIGGELIATFGEIYSAELESFFSMPQRAITLMNGKQKATLEDLEILLTLSKFGHIIEFDDNTKSVNITKTNDPSIVAIFSDSNGTKCEFKVWGEGKNIAGSYSYEDYHWETKWDDYGNWLGEEKISDGKRTIKVEVPSTIKMHLKHGSNSLISMTYTWDSNLKNYINTHLNLQVTNLKYIDERKISTTEASAVFSFSYGNKGLIAAAINLPEYKLIPWEGGNDITDEEIENWLEEYDEHYASLLGKVGKGEIKLDILGKILLKGGVTDAAALMDAYYNWGNEYYSDQLQQCQDLCDLLNKYLYLSLYYNNTTVEQAKLLMDVYEDYYGYAIEPVMYFPVDGTSIAVMTYFKSSKFLGLFDLIEDLVNSYIQLDKNHLIFGEDFVVDFN